jgi:myo-inositol-1(or 4)-monophosphatase
MTADFVSNRFTFAQSLIREAGALALGYFERLGSLTIKSKGLQDFVSEADLQTELLIRSRIAAIFPEDAFFGEETGATGLEGARGIWVVDPIDGTQPFLSGMRNWCVSIAFVFDGALQFGLVFSPSEDELFLGGQGIPATLNGKPIVPHAAASLAEGMTSVGFSFRTGGERTLAILARLLAAGGIFQRNGSGALSLCYVACGRVIGYIEVHINSWDCLAAIAIIHAAGGRTNDFLVGDALAKGNVIIAGNVAVYDQVAALLG